MLALAAPMSGEIPAALSLSTKLPEQVWSLRAPEERQNTVRSRGGAPSSLSLESETNLLESFSMLETASTWRFREALQVFSCYTRQRAASPCKRGEFGSAPRCSSS